MQKQVRLVSMLLCLGMGVAGGLPAYASSESVSVQQQNDVCKGIVKDGAGEPVIGASVVVKGTTNGAITDIDGKFSINGVKKGATIEVSFVGFVTQSIVWNGQSLNLTLKEDTETLDEIVVVGYGTQRRESLTGSLQTVKENKR